MSAKLRAAIEVGVVAVVLVVAFVLILVRGHQGPASLEERVREVASTLRCPVCRDLSIADSPSTIARSFRSTIARKLQAGETPDEIRADFVRSYGDWILLSPPSRGLGLLPWVVPIAILLVGILSAGLAIRRWRSPPISEPPPEVDRALLASARASLPRDDP